MEDIEARLSYLPQPLRDEIEQVHSLGIEALIALARARADVALAKQEPCADLLILAQCENLADLMFQRVETIVGRTREFVERIAPAMNTLLDVELARLAKGAGLLPESDVVPTAKLLVLPVEGAGDMQVANNLTFGEPFLGQRTPVDSDAKHNVIGHTCEALAAESATLGELARLARSFGRRAGSPLRILDPEPIDAKRDRAEKLRVALERHEQSRQLAAEDVGVTYRGGHWGFHDLDGELTLRSLAAAVGLDDTATLVLTWLYRTPSRATQREWEAARRALGLSHTQIEAARVAIGRFRTKFRELLSSG